VNTALGVASFAVAFLPFGILASFGLDGIKNSNAAQRQKQVLADYYRVPVARQLGIDPNSVNVRDLELAAQVNPMIANAIAKVDRDKNSANRGNLMASAAAGAVSWIPGVGGIANGVAKGAVHMAGGLAGGMASSLMDKKVLHTQDVMEHINAKRAEGQAVEATDVVMLRLSQDERLQDDIKKRTGKAFHTMDDAQKFVVMQSMPQLMQTAASDADALNRGTIDEASLIVASPGMQAQAPKASWASRVGGPRATQGSFAASVQADRANGALLQRS
jgi:hypothetical protein